MALIHFLIVFDRETQSIITKEEFSNGRRAGTAYAEREREYHFDPRYEIVLLGADSIETLKVTHAQYFPAEEATGSTYLVGV